LFLPAERHLIEFGPRLLKILCFYFFVENCYIPKFITKTAGF